MLMMKVVQLLQRKESGNMYFIILLIISLIVFLGVRLVAILFYEILCCLFKSKEKNDMGAFNFLFSLAFLGIYMQVFSGALQAVIPYMSTTLELYMVYTSLGIIAMIWCYFRWDFKFKAKPRFGKNDIMTVIKKIIVYSVVMCFSVYYGYVNINKLINGQEIDITILLVNATIVPVMIALDRILNQIMNLINQIKLENTSRRN